MNNPARVNVAGLLILFVILSVILNSAALIIFSAAILVGFLARVAKIGRDLRRDRRASKQ
jgi:hypothetical protein